MRLQKIKPVKTPHRGTSGSAGIDFFIPETFIAREINPGERVNIPSGIRAEVPAGHALIAYNKSGVFLKKGLSVGACVVDEDYQGEIHLSLHNPSNEPVVLNPGDKIVQFLLIPVTYTEIESYDHDFFDTVTERGEGGFGSTGDK